MQETKWYIIDKIMDFLEIPEDRFVDMLPELVLWHKAARRAKEAIPEVIDIGFEWIDDGESKLKGFSIELVKDPK
jgi:hypothetical protein